MELKSIAFIPDGNRRYAKKHRLSLLQAYKVGTQKAWHVLDWLNNYKHITTGTFYMLSLENFKERFLERQMLFKIFDRELDKVKTSGIFESNDIKLKFIGSMESMPKKLIKKIREAEEFTENFTRKTIYMALGYNGRTEIVDAAKKLAKDYKEGNLSLNQVNEESFKNYLYSNFKEPDLILRTGGMPRLSTFLTYQSVYSELLFLDKYWPEFTEQDLDSAVLHYNGLQRNFGK